MLLFQKRTFFKFVRAKKKKVLIEPGMMFFFQVFTDSCASQNVSKIYESRFNRAFLKFKAAYWVTSVDRTVLTISTTNTFEKNTSSDSVLESE